MWDQDRCDIKGRIIDLSYRAALALGIVQAGKLPVEVHRR